MYYQNITFLPSTVSITQRNLCHVMLTFNRYYGKLTHSLVFTNLVYKIPVNTFRNYKPQMRLMLKCEPCNYVFQTIILQTQIGSSLIHIKQFNRLFTLSTENRDGLQHIFSEWFFLLSSSRLILNAFIFTSTFLALLRSLSDFFWYCVRAMFHSLQIFVTERKVVL